MMKYYLTTFKLLRLIAFVGLIFINEKIIAQNQPIIVEAESGVLGADFDVLSDGVVTFVTPKTDFAGTTSPGNDTKIITFTVTFSSAGTYDLFARLRVGAGDASDDSFYYGNGFGSNPAGSDAAWIRVNGIGNVGVTSPKDVVDGKGNTLTETWKWINLSEFQGDETPITFIVTTPNTPMTFQYGARENGLDLDKIAFGKSDLYFTVSNLENNESGSTSILNSPDEPIESYYQRVETYTNPILPGDHPI